MKILNLYSGLGGNRKLWSTDHEITSVEKDAAIAKCYQDLFPNDQVIVGDAHEYLLNNYSKFDFIWASPSCTTHSAIRLPGVFSGSCQAVYPDMKLWQEIIFLQNYFKGKFIVENVKPFYLPLVSPSFKHDRHYFWSNFPVGKIALKSRDIQHNYINHSSTIYGFSLDKKSGCVNRRQILRNLIDPELGSHILNSSLPFYKQPSKQLVLDFAA
ncbi:MAG: DNA cytosine methyltransferase [Desulfotalea sp.]